MKRGARGDGDGMNTTTPETNRAVAAATLDEEVYTHDLIILRHARSLGATTTTTTTIYTEQQQQQPCITRGYQTRRG